MSLWADYINECGLLEIIEEPHGFVTFHLDGPESDHVKIADLYIAPSGRKSGHAKEFVARVEDFAKKYDCDKIKAVIHSHSEIGETSLKAALACGFTVQGESGPYILIEKSVGGQCGR